MCHSAAGGGGRCLLVGRAGVPFSCWWGGQVCHSVAGGGGRCASPLLVWGAGDPVRCRWVLLRCWWGARCASPLLVWRAGVPVRCWWGGQVCQSAAGGGGHGRGQVCQHEHHVARQSHCTRPHHQEGSLAHCLVLVQQHWQHSKHAAAVFTGSGRAAAVGAVKASAGPGARDRAGAGPGARASVRVC